MNSTNNDEFYEPTPEEYEKYFSDTPCGTIGTKCNCDDCITYFRNDIVRPIRDISVDLKDFNNLLESTKRAEIKELMLKERYKSLIFAIVPYNKWSDLINNNTKYEQIFDKLKESKQIPDEEAEICKIGNCVWIDVDSIKQETFSISYRYPSSKVKYELIVNKETGRLTTTSRGNDISD